MIGIFFPFFFLVLRENFCLKIQSFKNLESFFKNSNLKILFRDILVRERKRERVQFLEYCIGVLNSRAGLLRYFQLETLFSIQKHKCPALKITFFWARNTKTTYFL